jgi:GTP-binding protein LepA
MDTSHIRNFSIIAHIDHGKSTLADRMLEVTGTIEKRKMREQVLDMMELERERGITIKMQPVRMDYIEGGKQYTLNLIDTPGHIDFSYEVSRALAAVEGVVLLVDGTQGVQAQTITTLEAARALKLPIIPVVNKIDLPGVQKEEIVEEMVRLLGCKEEEIVFVSGKTGEGVPTLLSKIVKYVPPPKHEEGKVTSLIFDFEYSNHQGVIIFVRVFSGTLKKGDTLRFISSKKDFQALEVGFFAPHRVASGTLSAGEIGYIVTGIKEPRVSRVGDTVTLAKNPAAAIAGFSTPLPVVWASIYPESQDDFDPLRHALAKLSLSDASFSYEEEGSGTLGRGFRIGFLGMLHLEIITERLRREHNLKLVVTTPTIAYKIIHKNGKEEIIYSPHRFPDHGTYETALEPWVDLSIIMPVAYVGLLVPLYHEHEAEVGETDLIAHDRAQVKLRMPLRELMRNFFDELKSVSQGYASLSYEIGEMRTAHVERLDVLIAEEPVAAFSRIVAEARIEREAKDVVERLHKVLPRQLFVVKIQARAKGRIISSHTLSALKKDVTGYLYGGDITRKMKLREKQKRGKKKLSEHGRVNIPQDVFIKMMRRGES